MKTFSDVSKLLRSLPGKAVLAIGRQLSALVLVTGDLGESDGDGGCCRFSQTATLLLKSQGCGLGEARVCDFVIQQVHDLAKVFARHISPSDRLDHPTAFHPSTECLALRIARVPGRGDDLHCHCTLAALPRLIPQDAEGTLFELHIMRGPRRCRCREWHIRVLRAKALQVLCADPSHKSLSTRAAGCWRANEEIAGRQEAADACPQEQHSENRALGAATRHGNLPF
mmetsp:Transcript_16389/g.51485  ORF Transcript_16389/g.51485 Transcript_16389/m.51485 type:complete len:227 (+) Transcript_16389:113-793(+)